MFKYISKNNNSIKDFMFVSPDKNNCKLRFSQGYLKRFQPQETIEDNKLFYKLCNLNMHT